jgi:hypothetical protein
MLMCALISMGCATKRTPLQVSVFPPAQLVSEDTEVDGLRLDIPYGRNDVVRGLDIGLVGEVTEDMTGLQLQLFSSMAKEVKGAQFSFGTIFPPVFNEAESLRGLQCSGWVFPPVIVSLGINCAKEMHGIQVATAANIAGATPILLRTIGEKDWAKEMHSSPAVPHRIKGAQLLAPLNWASTDASLFQLTGMGANVCQGEFKGVQTTLFIGCNYVSGDAKGLQLVPLGANLTRGKVSGIQIGAINWASQIDGLQIGILNRCEQLHGVQVGLGNFCIKEPLPFFPVVNARF